jgi:hypothetical protein
LLKERGQLGGRKGKGLRQEIVFVSLVGFKRESNQKNSKKFSRE